jgi:hypothetical protein
MREVSGAGIRFFAGFNCAASLFASPDAMSAFRHVSDLTPAWLDVGEGQQQSKSTPGEFSLGPVLPPPPTNDRVRRGSFRHGNGVTYSADSKPENRKAWLTASIAPGMLAQLAALLNRPGSFPFYCRGRESVRMCRAFTRAAGFHTVSCELFSELGRDGKKFREI